MAKTYNLVGKIFGRLKVISLFPERTLSGAKKWMCECECGGYAFPTTADLNKGQTKSCGCLVIDVNISRLTTHGYSSHTTKRTPTWNTWMSMKRRCMDAFNPNYGGKGITVCEEWLNFENFLRDMGDRPLGKTLDREDNSKGYYKENCRWATPKDQVLNSSTPKFLTFEGVILTKTDMSKKYSMSIQTLTYRINSGMSIETALKTPVGKRRPKNGN